MLYGETGSKNHPADSYRATLNSEKTAAPAANWHPTKEWFLLTEATVHCNCTGVTETAELAKDVL